MKKHDPNQEPGGGEIPASDAPLHPDTLAVHGAGFEPSEFGALVPPVHVSTVFEFESAAEMAATFRGEKTAYVYTRYGNPTLDRVERHMAALEGAEAAVATASGMAAITTALLTVLAAGDHLVAAADLYGGTRNLLDGILGRLGIETSYFPIEDLQGIEDRLRPATRAIYVETPTNPTLKVIDLERVGRLARERGLPVLVDNTFATPILQRPLALGCHLVVHSATKALAGHDDVTAGFVVGPADRVARAREVMKWTGGCLDPHAAWLLERGLKTLALRVARQSDNALRLAGWLQTEPRVARVHYPGLESHPGHQIARRQMTRFGGLLAFELRGGAEAVERFSRSLKLIRLAPTLGGVETIFLVPAISSHIRLSPEERQAIGITDGLVRLSCGLEDPADLIADLKRGLEA